MRRLLAPLALSVILLGAGATSAVAQQPACDSYSDACVLGTKFTRPAPSTQVAPAAVVNQRPNTLPLTGGQFVLLLGVSGGLVAGGAVLLLSSRRRTIADSS